MTPIGGGRELAPVGFDDAVEHDWQLDRVKLGLGVREPQGGFTPLLHMSARSTGKCGRLELQTRPGVS
jgi:hypothetical protein